MANQHRSVLSDQHQPAPTGGRGYLALTRWVIFIERHWFYCGRFYAVVGAFLAIAWFGLFAYLPSWLHFIVLSCAVAAIFYSLRGSKLGWQWPSEQAAARRLETDSALAHRPFEALAARPATPLVESTQRGVWKAHQARARQALAQLKLPRFAFVLPLGERYAVIRLVIPVLVMVAVAAGWGELGLRLSQALTVPDVHAPSVSRSIAPLDAWITPPAYTKLPPIMLAQSESGAFRDTGVPVPAGSVLALRVNLGADGGDTPPILRTSSSDAAFKAAGAGGFTFDAPVPDTTQLDVRLGWSSLAKWRVAYVPDQAPEIVWRTEPKIDGQDIVLDFTAHDDYGLTKIEVVLDLAVSAPGLSNRTVKTSLAGAGQKNLDGKVRLDLTTNSWSGMPVTLRLAVTDQINQVAMTAPVTLTLPERKFDNPVARMLVAARKKLLISPDVSWTSTSNMMAGIANNPAAFHGDFTVLLALRSAAMRMHLDQKHVGLTPAAEMMWQVALRLETGGLVAAQDALRAAQRKLEEALANNADPETIKQLTQQLGQAMAQYMQALSENLAAQQGEIPPELMDDDAGRNIADEIMQKMQQIQDLSATGAREAAQQKLQELQKMLQDLAQAKPMTPEQQADMADFKKLKNLIDKQQKLQDDTDKAEQKPGSAEGSALAQQQDKLRDSLGQIVRSLTERHPDVPPQLATADQSMKGAGQSLGRQEWPEAKSKQGKALDALKEMSKDMQKNMKMQVLRLPSGRKEGKSGSRPDPFATPNPTDQVEDDGSIKVPTQEKVKRAREILDELRRRSGEYERPQEEREYIERLLNSF